MCGSPAATPLHLQRAHAGGVDHAVAVRPSAALRRGLRRGRRHGARAARMHKCTGRKDTSVGLHVAVLHTLAFRTDRLLPDWQRRPMQDGALHAWKAQMTAVQRVEGCVPSSTPAHAPSLQGLGHGAHVDLCAAAVTLPSCRAAPSAWRCSSLDGMSTALCCECAVLPQCAPGLFSSTRPHVQRLGRLPCMVQAAAVTSWPATAIPYHTSC